MNTILTFEDIVVFELPWKDHASLGWHSQQEKLKTRLQPSLTHVLSLSSISSLLIQVITLKNSFTFSFLLQLKALCCSNDLKCMHFLLSMLDSYFFPQSFTSSFFMLIWNNCILKETIDKLLFKGSVEYRHQKEEWAISNYLKSEPLLLNLTENCI